MQTEAEIRERIALLEKSRDQYVIQANQELAGIEARINELKLVLDPAPLAPSEGKKVEVPDAHNTG